jgi:hypothetical protein
MFLNWIRIHIGSAFDGYLDPDLHSECGSRSMRPKGKTQRKVRYLSINTVPVVLKSTKLVYKWLNVALFSLKLNP